MTQHLSDYLCAVRFGSGQNACKCYVHYLPRWRTNTFHVVNAKENTSRALWSRSTRRMEESGKVKPLPDGPVPCVCPVQLVEALNVAEGMKLVGCVEKQMNRSLRCNRPVYRLPARSTRRAPSAESDEFLHLIHILDKSSQEFRFPTHQSSLICGKILVGSQILMLLFTFFDKSTLQIRTWREFFFTQIRT